MEIQVYDILGNILYEEKLASTQSQLKVGGNTWSPGLYFLKVSTHQEQKVIRMIKVKG